MFTYTPFHSRSIKSIGATKMGQQYLLTKAMLQSSATLNLAMYLLLKAEQASDKDGTGSGGGDASLMIQSHPVMLYLQKLNSLIQNLEDNVEQKVPGLTEQLASLVKAAALLDKSGVSSDESGSDEDDDDDEKSGASEPKPVEGEVKRTNVKSGIESGSPNSESSSSESSDDDDEKNRKVLLTEARFGLRPNEVANAATQRTFAKRRKAPFISDAGDEDMEETDQKAVSQSLATTLNSIEQRSASRNNRRAAPLADVLDEPQEDDGELRRGLEMMEAELGKRFDDDDDEHLGGDLDDPDFGDDAEDDNDFYAQVTKKSKTKKEVRKNLYRVAPKFPRVENEVEGERAISKQILKNRGLVAHKAKINRNPRVKKREQYRKALIRRKGAVREVRTDEGHRYGGEETGIKTNLSRSRKLAR